jgi:hypothetical protein
MMTAPSGQDSGRKRKQRQGKKEKKKEQAPFAWKYLTWTRFTIIFPENILYLFRFHRLNQLLACSSH